MGQGQQKPTINPNSQQPATSQTPSQQSSSNPIINNNIGYIRQALRNCSTNGYLTKDSFNQVLAVLENLGFKRLRDTPIADRLFSVLDQSNSGRVSENDVSKTMNQIISDKNSALMYTFKAYDHDKDNRVSRRQFLQLIEDSWRAAYRILAQKCDGNSYGRVTIRDLQAWAASKVQDLNQHSSKLFSKLDSQKSGFIQFQAFKQFVTSSGYNDIVASINMDKVVVPINLTNLYLN